jgi:hypothetical protein
VEIASPRRVPGACTAPDSWQCLGGLVCYKNASASCCQQIEGDFHSGQSCSEYPCSEPQHSEETGAQLRHARNHGGISDPAAGAQRLHETPRFVARRSSRAFARAASSSPERFGAVPKNTSSGVWPRKAAWGILVLCSSTKNATKDRTR